MRLALRNALWPLGRFETGFGHLRDAERLATELDDPRRLGWIAAYLAEHTRMTGHALDAPAFAERALRIGEELDDLPLRVAVNYYIGTAYFVAGDYRRTDEFFPRILQLLEGDRFRERCGLAGFPVVMSRGFWAMALAERGEFDRAIAEAREGVRLAEALDHPYSVAFVLRCLGRPYTVRGDFDRAIRLTERGLAVSRDRHLPQVWSEIADQLGWVYALSSRFDEGLPLLEGALTSMESMGMVQWRTPVLVHLGEAYLLAGRREDALATAGRGLTLARERGHRVAEAWALRLLAEIVSRPNAPDVETAEGHYRQALALAHELGMRPLEAHCHFGLGELHRRTGERAKAAQHLATARAMYHEMGMDFWLAKAETARTTAS